MTFGGSLESMLQRVGYSLVSEFITPDRRLAVRLRETTSAAVIVMYHRDALELARGIATVSAIMRRNRSVFAVPEAAMATDGTKMERTT
jgi:hypothetical protein